MKFPRSKPAMVSLTVVGLVSPILLSSSVGATVTKTVGNGISVSVSWTEYDPDDLLGLPGNVHIGYLGAEDGPYGTYFYGSVTDFDCDEGETPYGGHFMHEEIVEVGADAADEATDDAIQAVVDSGESAVDADLVLQTIGSEVTTEVPDAIEEEFEEFPTCDYIQDRNLEAGEDMKLSVDRNPKVARITGRLSVTSGGHGEVSTVLGTPPVDITITGGNWSQYENSGWYKGRGYYYSYYQSGTSMDGGVVTGGIGAMGFADDVDDESYGNFGFFRYRATERVR